MPNYSRNEVVLVRYPFSDLTSFKVRPAVVINQVHASHDLKVGALTSNTSKLLSGEFVLANWSAAGLKVETANHVLISRDGKVLLLQPDEIPV